MKLQAKLYAIKKVRQMGKVISDSKLVVSDNTVVLSNSPGVAESLAKLTQTKDMPISAAKTATKDLG